MARGPLSAAVMGNPLIRPSPLARQQSANSSNAPVAPWHRKNHIVGKPRCSGNLLASRSISPNLAIVAQGPTGDSIHLVSHSRDQRGCGSTRMGVDRSGVPCRRCGVSSTDLTFRLSSDTLLVFISATEASRVATKRVPDPDAIGAPAQGAPVRGTVNDAPAARTTTDHPPRSTIGPGSGRWCRRCRIHGPRGHSHASVTSQ